MSRLWDPTDPLPPNQPKECGYSVLSAALYKLLPSGDVLINGSVDGFTMSSYGRLSQQTWSAGSNQGAPTMTLSFGN